MDTACMEGRGVEFSRHSASTGELPYGSSRQLFNRATRACVPDTQRSTRRTQTWVHMYASFRSRDVRHLFRARTIAFDAREASVPCTHDCVRCTRGARGGGAAPIWWTGD